MNPRSRDRERRIPGPGFRVRRADTKDSLATARTSPAPGTDTKAGHGIRTGLEGARSCAARGSSAGTLDAKALSKGNCGAPLEAPDNAALIAAAGLGSRHEEHIWLRPTPKAAMAWSWSCERTCRSGLRATDASLAGIHFPVSDPRSGPGLLLACARSMSGIRIPCAPCRAPGSMNSRQCWHPGIANPGPGILRSQKRNFRTPIPGTGISRSQRPTLQPASRMAVTPRPPAPPPARARMPGQRSALALESDRSCEQASRAARNTASTSVIGSASRLPTRELNPQCSAIRGRLLQVVHRDSGCTFARPWEH